MADDVEVYLAYQNKLKKALGLTSDGRNAFLLAYPA
ncbi:hypothetical protein KCP71_17555 [Salmonella enterica subsp. enterica]|nr:hypothetical protein KCP71_17555 [Salmonella enterica subsp. enterica]